MPLRSLNMCFGNILISVGIVDLLLPSGGSWTRYLSGFSGFLRSGSIQWAQWELCAWSSLHTAWHLTRRLKIANLSDG